MNYSLHIYSITYANFSVHSFGEFLMKCPILNISLCFYFVLFHYYENSSKYDVYILLCNFEDISDTELEHYTLRKTFSKQRLVIKENFVCIIYN